LQLIKFIFGIILVQLTTAILVYLAPNELSVQSIAQISIPLLFIAILIAFWFNSLSAHEKKDALYKAEGNFAKEKEKLKVKAQKDNIKTMKEAQKEIVHEATKTHAKANFKVGASFAGVLAIGGLFVLAQMVTAGLLVMTATGGVLGGYYWRGKRLEKQGVKEISNPKNLQLTKITDVKVIEKKKR
jgi:ABC-type siderophore export system fused ATPase/permease subunit